MLDRALIVAIIIVSLGIAGLIGYTLATPDEPPAPAETPSDTDGAQQPEPKPPQVFEKDVPVIVSTAYYRDVPEVEEQQTLRFNLVAGNSVEGQVTVWRRAYEDKTPTIVEKGFPVFGHVEDPYGNIVLKTARYSFTNSNQEYPWRFAFTAATTGEYALEVNTGGVQLMGDTVVTAHLKVTAYDR